MIIVISTGEALSAGGQFGIGGWTPVLALVVDGSRVVQQVVDFTGGNGVKPAVGLFVGADGLVDDIADAVNVRGAAGVGAPGEDAWTAIEAIVADGERRVKQVVDWVGGSGAKPDVGMYVGAAGYVALASQAVDIRGPVDTTTGTALEQHIEAADPHSQYLMQSEGDARYARVLNDASGDPIAIIGNSGEVVSPIVRVGVSAPKPDGFALYGATVSTTTALVGEVKHPENPFRESHIGKLISFWQKQQVGGTNRRGVIQNVSSDGNTAYVLFNSGIGTAISNATVLIGSDLTPAMLAVLAEAKSKRCSVNLGYGIYTFGDRFTVPQGVDIIGRGRNKAIGSSIQFEYTGTSLALLGGVSGINNSFILLSDAGGVQSKPQAGLYDLNVDAMFNVFYGVDATGGYGNEMERISVCRPFLIDDSACINVGLSTRLYNSFMDAHSAGQCMRAFQVADSKVKNNWLASSATGKYNAKISACTDFTFSGNHSFKNGTTPGLGGQVIIESFGGAHSNIIELLDNIFDTSGGPHVRVQTSASTGGNLRGIKIDRNTLFQNNAIPNGVYNAFEINIGPGSVVNGLEITNNTGTASWQDVSIGGYAAMLDYQYAGAAVYLDKVENNDISNCAAIFTGNRLPAKRGGNAVRVGTTSTVVRTSNDGRSTQSGTGVQTAFTIPHGLSGTPVHIDITAGSAAAAGSLYATADATNITVTFSAPPANAANNVVMNWSAEI